MKRRALTKSRSAILALERKRSVAMSGQAPSVEKGRNIDSNTLLSMLSRMTSYFYSMVDPRKNRFYYRCLPEDGARVHGHCPIRDLGSAWDTATLVNFWRRRAGTELLVSSAMSSGSPTWVSIDKRLCEAVKTTIGSYTSGKQLVDFKAGPDNRQCSALSTKFLEEPSNIAHSAFLVLAITGALRLSIIDSSKYQMPVNNLVNGILSMERDDSGAFAIHFGSSDVYSGIEFYPGEALLSLLDAYQYSSEESKLEDSNAFLSEPVSSTIVPAAVRAFLFYADYYRCGNIDEHYTSFFGNWQVQCFTKLFEILRQKEQTGDSNRAPGTETSNSETFAKDFQESAHTVTSDDVADYVFELCDAIINSGSWQQLMKGRWRSLATVEIACGLEALADGAMIALQLPSATSSVKVSAYKPFIEKAVEFLGDIQDQVPPHAVGNGGLAHTMLVKEQRLDVTGHAVNALVKVFGLHQMLQYTEERDSVAGTLTP